MRGLALLGLALPLALAPTDASAGPPAVAIVSPGAGVTVVAGADGTATLTLPLEAVDAGGNALSLSAYVYGGSGGVHYSVTQPDGSGLTRARASHPVTLPTGVHQGYVIAWTTAPFTQALRWFTVTVKASPPRVTYQPEVRVVAATDAGAEVRFAFEASDDAGNALELAAYVYGGDASMTYVAASATPGGTTVLPAELRARLPEGTHDGYVIAWTSTGFVSTLRWFQVVVEAAASPLPQVNVTRQEGIRVVGSRAGGAPVALAFEALASGGRGVYTTAYIYDGDGGVLFEQALGDGQSPIALASVYRARLPVGTHQGYVASASPDLSVLALHWFVVTVE